MTVSCRRAAGMIEGAGGARWAPTRVQASLPAPARPCAGVQERSAVAEEGPRGLARGLGWGRLGWGRAGGWGRPPSCRRLCAPQAAALHAPCRRTRRCSSQVAAPGLPAPSPSPAEVVDGGGLVLAGQAALVALACRGNGVPGDVETRGRGPGQGPAAAAAAAQRGRPGSGSSGCGARPLRPAPARRALHRGASAGAAPAWQPLAAGPNAKPSMRLQPPPRAAPGAPGARTSGPRHRVALAGACALLNGGRAAAAAVAAGPRGQGGMSRIHPRKRGWLVQAGGSGTRRRGGGSGAGAPRWGRVGRGRGVEWCESVTRGAARALRWAPHQVVWRGIGWGWWREVGKGRRAGPPRPDSGAAPAALAARRGRRALPSFSHHRE
jgi:hypothetical protein